MFTTTRTVSVAFATILLLAACGSDDNGASTDSTVTDTSVTETSVTETSVTETSVTETSVSETSVAGTTPETTPDSTDATTDDTTASNSEAAPDVAADTAAAQGALLTLADFPEGWTETPAADDQASEIDAAIAECVGADGVSSSPAQATSGDFSSPDAGLVVYESVNVQATEQDARLVLAGVADPKVLDCVSAAYTELGAAAVAAGGIADGAVLGEIAASRLAVASAGDATQAIRVAIPVTSGDAATQLTVDHVFVRAGRSLASITFEGRREATPVETIDPITAVAASRLPA